MKQESARQSAAAKARMRRLRARYRKRIFIIALVFFIIGIVAGIYAHRWYAGRSVDASVSADIVTPEPTDGAPEEEAEESWSEDGQADDAWSVPEGEDDASIFPEDEPEAASEEDAAGQDAFPEVEAEVEAAPEEAAPEEGEPQAEAEPAAEEQPEEAAPEEGEQQVEAAPEEGGEAEPEITPAPDESSDQVEEYDPAQGEVPEEYLTLEDENGEAEAPAEEVPAEEAPAEETPAEEAPAEETPVEETPAETEAEAPAEEASAEAEAEAPAEEAPAETEAEAPAEEASAEAEAEVPAEEASAEAEAEAPAETASLGPQVIAIVPYGESFTYSTQIKADGTARVEATDEPYETVSFTQTMQSYMRPSDFAAKYSTQYKLQGNEAGAGFELVLNDYTGEATIVPQNVIDISLRSESGNTVERGYQLMDAEIAGNYGVALTTNTPKVLYKRYPFSNTGEEMDYLVVTTYNDGATQQILFELESDEPEPTPEPVYAILQRGVKSEEVTRLQARLIELGYLTGTADGTFGQMTEDAIKKAQEAFGQEVTGIADNAFQQKLYEGVEAPAPAADSTNYETLNTSSTGELVVNLQLRLRELGYYDGRADGGYGPQTEAAVKRAQAAFGLEATGIADGELQSRLFGGAAATPAPEEAPAGEEAEG